MRTIKNLFSYTELIFSFLYPICVLVAERHAVMPLGFFCAGLLLALQIVCIVVFYQTRSRWEPYFRLYTKRPDWPPDIEIFEAVKNVFLLLMILMFGFLFPQICYLKRPMDGTLALLFSAFLLKNRFAFVPEGAKRWRYWPLLTLAGIAVLVIRFPVSNPSLVASLLLGLYCVEITVSFVWQVARQQRERGERL